MNTEVIMKRELFGKEISQKSKSEFFSATDLVRAGNIWRISNGMQPFDMSLWFRQKSVIEYMEALENQFGIIKISGRGRGKHTCTSLSFYRHGSSNQSDLKIEVYSWLLDKLLLYRNNSGDSYKKMAGALYVNHTNKREFPFYIKDVANKIKLACHVDDWEAATENQLKLRDKIQENILLLSDVLRDNDQAVKISIIKAIDNED